MVSHIEVYGRCWETNWVHPQIYARKFPAVGSEEAQLLTSSEVFLLSSSGGFSSSEVVDVADVALLGFQGPFLVFLPLLLLNMSTQLNVITKQKRLQMKLYVLVAPNKSVIKSFISACWTQPSLTRGNITSTNTSKTVSLIFKWTKRCLNVLSCETTETWLMVELHSHLQFRH